MYKPFMIELLSPQLNILRRFKMHTKRKINKKYEVFVDIVESILFAGMLIIIVYLISALGGISNG